MKNTPFGALNVNAFALLPVARLASALPGLTPPSRTKSVGERLPGGIAHDVVTVFPATEATRFVGACSVGVGVVPACVTLNVIPAMRIDPPRDAVSVFANTEYRSRHCRCLDSRT